MVEAPPRPPRIDPDALFAEARRHRRRRRLRVALVALGLAAAGIGAYAAFGSSGSFFGLGGGLRAGVAPKYRAVVLLVDVSGSMRANDVKPTRLDATVAALDAFVAHLPRRIEVGVVTFSSSAKVALAPTRDHARVRNALDVLSPLAGTALGDGLDAALALAQRMPKPAAIVLESDGAQNRGAITPAQAARRARAAGIRVDGVALGTPDGTVQFGFGGYQNRIAVPPDPQTVEQVARITGGQAFAARDAASLTAIYRSLAARIGG